jgi:hypothetical protein
MRRLRLLVLAVLAVAAASPEFGLAQVSNPSRIELQDEGVSKGRIFVLDCIGADLICAATGGRATITHTPTLAGANLGLSNLVGVAVNAALVPGAAGTLDLGSATLPWRDVWLAGSSGTPGTNNFRITGTATAARVLTLPNVTSTFATLAAQSFVGLQTFDGGLRNVNSTAGLLLGADVPLFFVANGDTYGRIVFSSSQSPAGAIQVGTGTSNNNVIIHESQDYSFNFGHAAQVDPTLWVHSHNQSTTQWTSLSHNGTDTLFQSGTGGLRLQGFAGSTGQGYPVVSTNNLFLHFSDISGLTTRIRFGNVGNPAVGGELSAAWANGVANSVGGPLAIGPGEGYGSAVPALLRFTGDAVVAGIGGGIVHPEVDRMILTGTKVLVNNTATTVMNLALASNSVAAGSLHYACEVFNGTDVQVETGAISWMVSNKAGVIANNTALKYGNQQLATAGTLTVTWALSAASPSLLSVNCNSSLTPSTGYPRVTYIPMNLTQQTMLVQ